MEDGKKKTFDAWNEVKEKAENIIESADGFLNTGIETIVHKTDKLKDAFKSGVNAYNDEKKYGKNQSYTFTDKFENNRKNKK